MRCALDPQAKPKLAAILLGEQTQHLFRELFPPVTGEADLFAGFAHIRRRIVLWGDTAAPVDLPHSGIVAPEQDLLERLWQRVPPLPQVTGGTGSGSARRLRSCGAAATQENMRCFGRRTGRIASVKLKSGTGDGCCWVESVPAGWLFLLALGQGMASLIAVGDTVEHLLAQSRDVGRHIDGIMTATAPIPVYPRLLQTLADDRSIACGSAAMSFDPLCGEGAGHAIREGFLAAAVLRAALAGSDSIALAEHYSARLNHGMLRHLQTCLPFYATGGSTAFWTQEKDVLQEGIKALQGDANRRGSPQFRLLDRDLVPL